MSRPASESAAATADAAAAAAVVCESKQPHQQPQSALQEVQEQIELQQCHAPQPSAPPQSVAQRCHADALHCIFAFLDLNKRVAAMRCCRDWHVAACKEPPRDFPLTIRSVAALNSLAASPLRRHAAAVNATFDLRLDALRRLRSLPRLTALDCALHGSDLRSALAAAGDSRERRSQTLRDALPPQLRCLAVTLSLAAGHSSTDKQALLDALPTLAQLTDLRVLNFHGESLDLSPLLQLPLLSHLSLDLRMTVQQCTVVKQLASLVKLGGDRCNYLFRGADELAALLTPPHRLQRLEQIGLRGCVFTPPLMALLQSLPVLTELEPGSLNPSCWADLRGLAQLRKIRFVNGDLFTADQLTSLGDSLSSLPHLSDVHIELRKDTDFPSPPLQLRLPALRQLTLQLVRLPPLSFLHHSPLLEELRLCGREHKYAEQVMASLRTHLPLRLPLLRLVNGVRLSDEQRADLQSPSTLLPSPRTLEHR